MTQGKMIRARTSNVGYRNTHWCPNGCGKRVTTYKVNSISINNKPKQAIFMCSVCKKQFIKSGGDFIVFEQNEQNN